jgi:hypothetical protein
MWYEWKIIHAEFWVGKHERKGHLEYLGLYRRMILKHNLKKKETGWK